MLLVILGAISFQNCPAQTTAKTTELVSGSATKVEQPPFDKLELFGFLAAGPVDGYTEQVARTRGCDFKPDEEFIGSFRFPRKQEILRNIKPRAVRTMSPGREAAFRLLRQAWGAREFAAVVESYEQALKLAPESATLHLAYAAKLLLSQKFPAAEAQARESLKLWPENAEGHANLALSLTAQKQFEEGEIESLEALRIFPGHHAAMFTLALSVTREHKYREAIPILRDAVSALPSIPELRKDLGVSLVETGETAEGISELSRYLKTAPADAEAHYYMGAAIRATRGSAEARREFAEALRLEPKNPLYEVLAHPEETAAAGSVKSGPKPEDGSVSGNIYSNKFFGFSYQFPKGWTVLGSDEARAAIEIGGTMIATGNATDEDIKKVAGRSGHALLFVRENGSVKELSAVKTAMILAVDVQGIPEITPRTYFASQAELLNHKTGVPMNFSGNPEEVSIGGRRFWKGSFGVQTPAGTRYGSQFVTADSGYLLVFSFSAFDGPELAAVHEMEETMKSVQFGSGRNRLR
ncbi:MAG TPA: tetratricopeptide repeat protein [Candidatus Acidoferrum sp.]|jgi:tetratricopeptide (TPR) repeat protein